LRELTFGGDLTASVITMNNYEVHAAYRAKVRSTVATLKDSVNGNVLKYHKINSIRTVSSPFYASRNRSFLKPTFIIGFNSQFRLTLSDCFLRHLLVVEAVVEASLRQCCKTDIFIAAHLPIRILLASRRTTQT
jgi:hypothetical protein